MAFFFAATSFGAVASACDLKVESAWIREAPLTAKAHAGYAKLSNTGGRPLRIVSVKSKAFADVQVHETRSEQGIVKMRPLTQFEIPAKTSIAFEPSGKHFMFIGATQSIAAGSRIAVDLIDATGCTVRAQFEVVGAGNR